MPVSENHFLQPYFPMQEHGYDHQVFQPFYSASALQLPKSRNQGTHLVQADHRNFLHTIESKPNHYPENEPRDYEDRYLGNNGGKTVNVHDQIHSIWKDLLNEELINENEYKRGTIQNFYKSPEEFTSPLSNTESAAYQNGLRLLKERTVYVDCPYKKKWKENQNTEEFSIGLMETIRSWSRHSFVAALDKDKESILNPVDILFDRLTQRISSDPENWSLDYVEHHLMMEKV